LKALAMVLVLLMLKIYSASFDTSCVIDNFTVDMVKES